MAVRYSSIGIESTNVRGKNLGRRAVHISLTAMWHGMRTFTERFLENRFFTPYVRKLTSIEQKWIASGQSFQIRVNGNSIQCWRFGTGPAILFVHGWNGSGMQFHPMFPRLLEAGFSITAFDMPAHGVSEGRTSSFFQFTDAVRAILNQNQRHNIRFIIGHSLGAGAIISGLYKENAAIGAVLIAPALNIGNILSGAFRHYGIPEAIWRHIIEKYEARYGYDLYLDSPHRLIRDMGSSLLIVHDESDGTTPYNDSKAIAEACEHVSLHTTRGLGHKRILTDPGVMDLMLDHISNSRD